MPTANRRRFAAQAIGYFLAQDYANKELVILDDGTESVADLIPDDPQVRYTRLSGKRTLGAKRNECVTASRGDLIMHWDDDDWIAPWRIRYQAESLLREQAEVCGLRRMLFYELRTGKSWLYTYQGSKRNWLAGGSLLYTRDFWRRSPFPNIQVASDTRFIMAQPSNRALALSDYKFYVALIHPRNTSPKSTRGSYWNAIPPNQITGLMGPAMSFYREHLEFRKTVFVVGQQEHKSAAKKPSVKPKPGQSAAPEARIVVSERHPRVSLVLPAHRSASSLVRRTVQALRAQTTAVDVFEVIVVADGGDPDGHLRKAVEPSSHGFVVRLIESNRPQGDLPHRNHARNAGCAAARGELLWVLDADFLLSPESVAHLLAEHDRVLSAGKVPIFSPCLAAINWSAETWLERSASWANSGDASLFRELWKSLPIAHDVYSGFSDAYRDGPPLSESWPRLVEGFPVVPHELWKALQGFDCRFVGWGGNKEEFVRRLLTLAKDRVVDVRLLRSVLAVHQPHAPDPGRNANDPMRRRNKQIFDTLQTEIKQGARWWQIQKRSAIQVVKEIRQSQPNSTGAGAQKAPPGGTRVGILTLNDPAKGLWRDAEILLWAFQRPPTRRNGKAPRSISVFVSATHDRKLLLVPRQAAAVAPKRVIAGAVRPGIPFVDWLKDLDVLICCELWLENAFALARESGVRVIYIPNLDWAIAEGKSSTWVSKVRSADVEIWAKTRLAEKILRECGIGCRFVPWSIPDPVSRDRKTRTGGAVKFLLNAGMGGWRNRRGVDLALEAFVLAWKEEPRIALTVRSIRPLGEYVPNHLLGLEGVEVSEGYLSRSELDRFYGQADVLLYPTRWDGFGLSLLEGLHAGLPVIATDGDPMRELVEHEHNGLLVAARQVGKIRLTPHLECSVEALAKAMVRLARDEFVRDRLTCPEPAALAARQHHFVMRVRQLSLGEAPPRVLLFVPAAAGQGPRRSEECWFDALREYGYQVEKYNYEGGDTELRKVLSREADFILVGKAPVEMVTRIRRFTNTPLVLWHQDVSDYGQGRWQWFKRVAPLCNLVAVPESGRGLFDKLPARIVQIFPGTKVEGDRGPGRRPRRSSGEWEQDSIVFLGQLNARRVLLLQSLSRSFDVRVHGETNGHRESRFSCTEPVWGEKAARLIRRSTFVLSTSVRNDYFYTSDRLFNSAGAGGCVLVQRFPNLERLYPPGTVIAFDDPESALARAREIAQDRRRQADLRVAAENHTWRYHTWLDRVGDLLRHVRGLESARPDVITPTAAPDFRMFWEKRAKDLGPRAVGHYRWDQSQFRHMTELVWAALLRHFNTHIRENDRIILDFGCGSGRFSKRLAELGFHVCGADISNAMLAMAREKCGHVSCAFTLVEPGRPLPFEAGSLDVLWTCNVLQHVPDRAFEILVPELRRVLAPGALVLLFENTHRHAKRTSTTGHVVFRTLREYLQAFPGLSVAETIPIEGEEHTVFAGRLSDRRPLSERA